MAEVPADAISYNGHSYKLFDDSMTWQEAKDYCESLGGHLVTITNKGEQKFIENLLQDIGSRSRYWLGGYRDDNNDWQWVTKEKFKYTNWYSPYQPDNYKDIENFLEIYFHLNLIYEMFNSNLS